MNDNATDLLNDAEIYLDEDILSEECKCQSSHGTSNGVCSGTVTSLSTHLCQPPKLICFEATIGNLRHMNLGKRCARCRRPASECWSIRPV